jgi:hypothetical protein
LRRPERAKVRNSFVSKNHHPSKRLSVGLLLPDALGPVTKKPFSDLSMMSLLMFHSNNQQGTSE